MSNYRGLDEHIPWGEDQLSADDEAGARWLARNTVAGWSHLAGDVRNTWHWFNAGDDRALCGYHPDRLHLTMRQSDDSQRVWSAFKCRHCEKRLAKQQAQA